MADYITLKASLRGDLIQPDDTNYDDVRKLYNGMIQKRYDPENLFRVKQNILPQASSAARV